MICKERGRGNKFVFVFLEVRVWVCDVRFLKAPRIRQPWRVGLSALSSRCRCGNRREELSHIRVVPLRHKWGTWHDVWRGLGYEGMEFSWSVGVSVPLD